MLATLEAEALTVIKPIGNVSQARVWHGTMPVQYLYTAGVAGERFFQTLRQKGVLAVTTCAECQVTYLPPRVYCQRCFADLSEAWTEVAPSGRVHTYTVVHEDQDGHQLDQPQLVALVHIDGTSGGLIGRLLHLRPQDVLVEMPVEAVLAPRRRRRGAIDDIAGFAPRRVLPRRSRPSP